LGLPFLWSTIQNKADKHKGASMSANERPTKDPFDMLLDSIRIIVREEITAAIGNGRHDEPDRLLTPQEAAAILGQDSEKGVRWLYRHAQRLPFSRRISRKNLKFCERGLRAWIAAKKPIPR
jgi:hypothetical protein